VLEERKKEDLRGDTHRNDDLTPPMCGQPSPPSEDVVAQIQPGLL
jgi:hypothetical protein